MLPVREKSTPALFFVGGFLAAAAMPAGDSLVGTAVLAQAGPKAKHSDGVMKSSSASPSLAMGFVCLDGAVLATR